MIMLWFLIGYVATLVTWVFYLAAMNLSENRDEISWPVKVLFAYPVVGLGYVVDMGYCLLAGLLGLLLGELPHEVLFTSKMNRWQQLGGMRRRIAGWFCRELLNPFAPDNHHCQKVKK